MTLVMTYLYIIAISISISLVVKKSLALSLPLAFILISFAITLGGYFGDLRIGVYGSLLWIVIAIIYLIRNKNTILTIKEWITKNYLVLVIYSILFVYVSLYHRTSSFCEWDEYSHWGPMVKGMFNFNLLYPHLAIANAHPDYPPLFQCIEYLFCYINRGYSEPSLYAGLSAFCISLYFPILDMVSNEDNHKRKIFIGFIFIILILMNITIRYNSIANYLERVYLDFPYSLLAATTIYLAYKNNDKDIWDYIIISAFLSALLLSKELGMAFFAMGIFIIFLLDIFKKKKIELKVLIFYILIPILFFISWKLYLNGISGQFDLSKISIGNIYNVIFNNIGEEWQLQTKAAFFPALFNLPILGRPLDVSLMTICLITTIVFILVVLSSNNDKTTKVIMIISWVLCIIGFISTMLVLYVSSCFSIGESVKLASFLRYFGSLVNFQIALITFLVIEDLINRCKLCKVLLLVFVLTLVSFSNINKAKNLLSNSHTYNYSNNQEFNEYVKAIDNNCPKGSRILNIDKSDWWCHIASYHYINGEYSFADHQTWETYPEDSFVNLYWNQFDYIYVWTVDDGIKEAWKKTNSDPLIEHQLYKVDGVTLRMVGN